MKKEFRFIDFKDSEVRAAEDSPLISGYAALFNVVTDIGPYLEVIRPGAFTRALKENQDVRALKNHDPNLILGRTKSGTLRLYEDDKGLRYEIDPPNTSTGKDTLEEIRRGDIDEMSFAFSGNDNKSKWSKRDGKALRELVSPDIFDVSIVTYPQYKHTSASVRSEEIRSAEEVYSDYIKSIEELPGDNSTAGEKVSNQTRQSLIAAKLKIKEMIVKGN